MTEDQLSVEVIDPPTTAEDPTGGVMIPLGHGAIIRAQALAGAVVGLSTILGMLPVETTTPHGFTI